MISRAHPFLQINTASSGPVASHSRVCLPAPRAILVCLVLSAPLFACSGVPVVGLAPEYPPLEKRALALFPDFVTVDTLQPSLRWQPLPVDIAPESVRIGEVRYELRIWSADVHPSAQLRYARAGLALAQHRLEEPLEPGARYFWSVRAHFTVNGEPRVSAWGMAGFALGNETVPNLACFRFRTPTGDAQAGD